MSTSDQGTGVKGSPDDVLDSAGMSDNTLRQDQHAKLAKSTSAGTSQLTNLIPKRNPYATFIFKLPNNPFPKLHFDF